MIFAKLGYSVSKVLNILLTDVSDICLPIMNLVLGVMVLTVRTLSPFPIHHSLEIDN